MSSAFKAPRRPPKTWGEWAKHPDTLATRADIIGFAAMQEPQIRQAVLGMIQADRPWNRLKRRVKAIFSRAETPKPDNVE